MAFDGGLDFLCRDSDVPLRYRSAAVLEKPLHQNDVVSAGTADFSRIIISERMSSDAAKIKATSLTKYLKTLIDLDILEREVPATEDNPEKSKRGLYRIKDNYLRFWFAFNKSSEKNRLSLYLVLLVSYHIQPKM